MRGVPATRAIRTSRGGVIHVGFTGGSRYGGYHAGYGGYHVGGYGGYHAGYGGYGGVYHAGYGYGAALGGAYALVAAPYVAPVYDPYYGGGFGVAPVYGGAYRAGVYRAY